MCKMKAVVDVNGNNNSVFVNSIVKLENPMDEIEKLLQSGKTEEASKLFARLINGASAQHPAYPHWIYGFETYDGIPIITHVPTSPEAAINYPLHYNIQFSIPNNLLVGNNINDLLKQCYQKQVSIEVNIHSIETWIGKQLIEKKEAEPNKPFEGILKPSDFPPPQPMKLYFENSDWSIDYLEMGLKEIVNDSELIIDNTKQKDCKFIVEILIDVANNRSNINIEIREQFLNEVEANYAIIQFGYYSKEENPIVLKFLKGDMIFFKAEKLVSSREFTKEIILFNDILKELVFFEKFYAVKFILPKNGFKNDDLRDLELLRNARDGKPSQGTFNALSGSVEKQGLKNMLEIDNEENGNVFKLCANNFNFTFLGAIIPFREREILFMRVRIKDKEKLKKKYELMDEDEYLKVVFEPIPGENKYYETLRR